MKLAKAYEPNLYEPTIYALWEKSQAFKPSGKGEKFSVVMPPPNANGNLHIGHALTYGIQDTIVRYFRMKGYDTVYIPGADHAGFETWVVYEKLLLSQGKSRFNFTREELYKMVWDFVEEQRSHMEIQLKALGMSCDWEHLVFTLDKKVIKTAYRTFRRLWNQGFIYRGERIVNYCPHHQTSFADIEVVYRDEKSHLWQIAYPLVDGEGEIIVATTRPETILGDSAVAVNPKDKRYQNLIGKKVRVPIINREVPIIADTYVDMTFGTGALKITPAHDPNDFEIGEQHHLERFQVISTSGTMTNVPDEFMGLDILTARQKTLKQLDRFGLRRGEETISHAVGHCYKCDTTIEPMVKEQWFLKMKPLADKAKEAINNNRIKFTPSSKKRVLIQYLDNLKDWNLSRQIPWGMPIPAFQNMNDPNDWIYDERVDLPEIEVAGKIYRREEDTFDTWFSSGQWPFVTTDFREKGELSRFYPTTTMMTATDLLDRWVARMIMLGLYATNDVPFKHVYLNGMVLDAKGQKMSKSKNNVINPMDSIAEYGSDALRIGLMANRSPGQNQAFSLEKIIAGRNFCNKLWNIARYIGDKTSDITTLPKLTPETIADHWIIRQLSQAISTSAKQFEKYRFAEASETIYHVIWDDVADWYLEASKTQPNPSLLAWILDTCLKLAQPIAPFLTETIWQALPWSQDLLIKQSWPQPLAYNEISASQFESLQELIKEIRFTTSELPKNKKYDLVHFNDSLLSENATMIASLARLNTVSATDQPTGLRLASSGRPAWLAIDARILKKHRTNLEERLNVVQEQITNLQKRLSNPAYLDKAPAHLVAESKKLLDEAFGLQERLTNELANINKKI